MTIFERLWTSRWTIAFSVGAALFLLGAIWAHGDGVRIIMAIWCGAFSMGAVWAWLTEDWPTWKD